VEYKIKCAECGEIGTVVVDLFHSGYLIATGKDTTDVRESEDTPEADVVARCYNCGTEYLPDEYHTLIVKV